MVDEWVCSARTVPSVSARWALAGGSSTESLADSTSERSSHAGRRRGLRRSGSARHLGLPAAHRDRPDGHASNASGASQHEALPGGPVQTERSRRRPSKPVSRLRSVRSSATSRFAPSLRPSTSHDAPARAPLAQAPTRIFKARWTSPLPPDESTSSGWNLPYLTAMLPPHECDGGRLLVRRNRQFALLELLQLKKRTWQRKRG